MAMIVRAFPVLPGKEDAALEFARAVGDSRKKDMTTFLQSFGVRRETWHLQRTAHGTLVIVVTDVEEPPLEKARAYSAAQGQYERWFKDNIKELCGIDPDVQPLGPPTETIFEWDSPHDRRRTLDAPAGGLA
jgi:hypothetical protein